MIIPMSMKIDEINKLIKTHSLQKSQYAERTITIEDKVSFSSEAIEAQKKAHFVQMLKEMPEITSLPTLPENVNRVIARKIYEEMHALI